eukprot:scaffold3455_cov213-Prasinococcus_capsulatus_cf.AAC.6
MGAWLLTPGLGLGRSNAVQSRLTVTDCCMTQQVRNPIDRFLSGFEEIMRRLLPLPALDAIRSGNALWNNTFDRPSWLSNLTRIDPQGLKETFIRFVAATGMKRA